MSTGSIKHNIVIDSVEQAERFLDALEKAERLPDNEYRQNPYMVEGRINLDRPEPAVNDKRLQQIKAELDGLIELSLTDTKVVYLVHEHSGSYEDYRDCVVAAFSHERTAGDYIANLEQELEQQKLKDKKCSECPYVWLEFEEIENHDTFERKALNHCGEAKVDWKYGRMACFTVPNFDYPSWSIQAIEVDAQ